jgi:glycosyltransferase involved in cell wall biosynthesis
MTTDLLSPSSTGGQAASGPLVASGTRLSRVKPRRPLRVCHVSMTLKTGGLERLLVDFGRLHDSSRFQLRFVALADLGPPAEDLMQLGFAVDSMQLAQVGKLAMLRRLKALLQRERIDIVHTHNTYAHFYGALAARLAGVKTVINSQHGRGCGPKWKDRLLFKTANRLSRRIVGVSRDATRLCQGEDKGSSRKMVTIWNGIDATRFAYRGPADRPTAISVARLSPEKDFATLLKAVAIVRRQVPDFRLKMVGNGAEREFLESLARELQITDCVEFLGERSDVHQLLPQAGFFVSSSKTEGISLTVLEAMAVGLPVVTTAVGGNPEIVEEGRTGYLVPSQNPDALAGAIVSMCQKRNEWPSMGRTARERVEQHFEIRHMIGEYERLYEALVGSR